MKTAKVEVKPFQIEKVSIEIVGISPLIVHAFSEKSRKMIEDKQQGKAKTSKHPERMPEDDFENAKHKSPLGWDGFPSAGIKASMLRGSKIIGLVMKDTQTSLFVVADCMETQLTRIIGQSRLRTDMVRVGMGTADVRYRPEYPDWSMKLTIEYNAGMVSIDEIYQMVAAAGYGCGLGEMRPEKTKFGFGRFKLKDQLI
jgi:hypothetical protein